MITIGIECKNITEAGIVFYKLVEFWWTFGGSVDWDGWYHTTTPTPTCYIYLDFHTKTISRSLGPWYSDEIVPSREFLEDPELNLALWELTH